MYAETHAWKYIIGSEKGWFLVNIYYNIYLNIYFGMFKSLCWFDFNYLHNVMIL